MNCQFKDCKKKAKYKECFLGMCLCVKHKRDTDRVSRDALKMRQDNPKGFNDRVNKYMEEIDATRNIK